jgi:hypothetical protein
MISSPQTRPRRRSAHSQRRRWRWSSPSRHSGTRIHAKWSATRRGHQGENDRVPKAPGPHAEDGSPPWEEISGGGPPRLSLSPISLPLFLGVATSLVTKRGSWAGGGAQFCRSWQRRNSHGRIGRGGVDEVWVVRSSKIRTRKTMPELIVHAPRWLANPWRRSSRGGYIRPTRC